jgi:hypothetical protein
MVLDETLYLSFWICLATKTVFLYFQEDTLFFNLIESVVGVLPKPRPKPIKELLVASGYATL